LRKNPLPKARTDVSLERQEGMITLAQKLMAGSALLIFLLGSLHLLYTFRGKKLYPRDTHLERQMDLVSPVISSQTTMWRAWIGFNASHSYGAIFFGLVYGYLALAQPAVLFQSLYLILVGLGLLLGYIFLAKAYWFTIPLVGISLATGFYVAALVVKLT
jgi:presenilin-like A22 family membrane protease